MVRYPSSCDDAGNRVLYPLELVDVGKCVGVTESYNSPVVRLPLSRQWSLLRPPKGVDECGAALRCGSYTTCRRYGHIRLIDMIDFSKLLWQSLVTGVTVVLSGECKTG